MNGCGKSDGPIVPKKPANNGVAARLDGCRPRDTSAEQVEGRGPAKGNSLRGLEDRTQGRVSLYVALERIRQAATRECLSRPAFARYDPRQEPGAVVPHAGICPGGAPQGASLPGTLPMLFACFGLTAILGDDILQEMARIHQNRKTWVTSPCFPHLCHNPW